MWTALDEVKVCEPGSAAGLMQSGNAGHSSPDGVCWSVSVAHISPMGQHQQEI